MVIIGVVFYQTLNKLVSNLEGHSFLASKNTDFQEVFDMVDREADGSDSLVESLGCWSQGNQAT